MRHRGFPRRPHSHGTWIHGRLDMRKLVASAVLVVSTLNIILVYVGNPRWGSRPTTTAIPNAHTTLVQDSGCGVLQGELREACQEERRERQSARERKAAKLREQEAALEVYKKKRRLEKKLKVEGQHQERVRQQQQQQVEEKSELDSRKHANEELERQYNEQQLLEDNPELANLSDLDRKIWFLKHKVAAAPAPPLPPGAGGEYAPWNSTSAWQRPCGGSAQAPLVSASSAPTSGTGPSWSDDEASARGGVALQALPDVEWIRSRGNITSLGLDKREYGHLSKKKDVYRRVKYHHQPSLALLSSGQVMAVWQAAESTEGEPDQHLRIAVSSNEGKTWPSSFELDVKHQGPLWAPVPHVDAGGRLWLFYVESEGDCVRKMKPKNRWPPGGSVKVVTTADGAVSQNTSWSNPRTVYSVYDGAYIPKMISNRLIVLSSGEWVLPYWRDNLMWAAAKWPDSLAHCRTKLNPASQAWSNTAETSSGLLVSKDGGSTWTARGTVTSADVPGGEETWGVGVRTTYLVENSVVELRNGDLLMLFRTHDTGFVYAATSSNKGYDWTEPAPTDLFNPDSKSQVMRVQPSGPLVVVFNDHKRDTYITHGKDAKLPEKCRTQLSLASSEDEGKTWRRVGVMKGGTAVGLRYHSPSLIQVGCKLLVAYAKLYVSGYKMKDETTHFSLRVAHVHIHHGTQPNFKVCVSRWQPRNTWLYMCRNLKKQRIEEDEEDNDEDGGERHSERIFDAGFPVNEGSSKDNDNFDVVTLAPILEAGRRGRVEVSDDPGVGTVVEELGYTENDSEDTERDTEEGESGADSRE